MTDTQAIKEIERLGGKVYESTPPPDPTRAAAAAPFLVAKLKGPQLGDQVRLLKHLAALDGVGIEAARIDDDDLAGLKDCGRLRSFGVVGSQRAAISDGALEDIARVRSLTDLDLEMAAVPESGFAHIAKLENLEQLRASGSGITDAALSNVAMLTRLKRLTLLDIAVTSAGVGELRSLANLQQLSIHSKGIRDGAIGQLKGLNVTELSIGDGITDAGLNDLADLKMLLNLTLDGLPITDQGLVEIAALKSLRILSLAGTEITDAGLIHLRPLIDPPPPSPDSDAARRRARFASRGLQALNLARTGITDHGLEILATFERVPRLGLARTKVTDRGMDNLQRAARAVIMTWPGQSTTSGTSGGRSPPPAQDRADEADGSNWSENGKGRSVLSAVLHGEGEKL